METLGKLKMLKKEYLTAQKLLQMETTGQLKNLLEYLAAKKFLQMETLGQTKAIPPNGGAWIYLRKVCWNIWLTKIT